MDKNRTHTSVVAQPMGPSAANQEISSAHTGILGNALDVLEFLVKSLVSTQSLIFFIFPENCKAYFYLGFVN